MEYKIMFIIREIEMIVMTKVFGAWTPQGHHS